MLRKAVFRRGICWCMFIQEDEVARMEEIYEATFVRWVS